MNWLGYRRMKKETAIVCGLITVMGLILLALNVLVEEFVQLEMRQNRNNCCTKTFSILCKYLSVHPDDDYLYFERHRRRWNFSVNNKGDYICTTRNLTNVVDKIAEKAARRRQAYGLAEPQYLACGNKSLARKTGDTTAYFNRISQHQNWTDDKIHWDNHWGNSFIDPKLPYLYGEITITETKIYSVYASVIFSVNQTKNDQRSISMRICRRISGYEGTLFGETQLIPAGNGNVYTTLHVGGQRVLYKGDILLVRVSAAQDLHQHSAGNKFVLFPMS